MQIQRNVGGRDRTLRGVLAGVFLSIAIGTALADRQAVAVVAGLSAAGLLFNYVFCFCGLNAALGLDTTDE